MESIRKGRHVVFNLHAHIVFVTKYRKNVFLLSHLEAMKKIFEQICSSHDVILEEFNGEENHVHLLLHFPPKTRLSYLINALKSISSRELKKQFIDLQKRYYKGHLWSPSYFIASCGGAPLAIIKQYIEQQNSPNC